MPGEVGSVAAGHRVGMSPKSCRRARVLIAAPCTRGEPLSVPAICDQPKFLSYCDIFVYIY
jgi:hypothetical protein